jgi:uncharacterized protein (DUF433 family)
MTVIAVFTEDQAARLTQVTRQQLRHWDRTGFFVASLGDRHPGAPYSRLYSFRDLVALKIIHALRNEAKIPLSHLREVREKLSALGNNGWAKTTLYVLNRRVIFDNPDDPVREDVVSGQAVLEIPLRVISGNIENEVKAMRQRDSALVGRVERHRNIAHNALVIAGTRIPVRSIKAFADAGYSVEQIRQEYPTLHDGDIRAAIAYDEVA